MNELEWNEEMTLIEHRRYEWQLTIDNWMFNNKAGQTIKQSINQKTNHTQGCTIVNHSINRALKHWIMHSYLFSSAFGIKQIILEFANVSVKRQLESRDLVRRHDLQVLRGMKTSPHECLDGRFVESDFLMERLHRFLLCYLSPNIRMMSLCSDDPINQDGNGARLVRVHGGQDELELRFPHFFQLTFCEHFSSFFLHTNQNVIDQIRVQYWRSTDWSRRRKRWEKRNNVFCSSGGTKKLNGRLWSYF